MNDSEVVSQSTIGETRSQRIAFRTLMARGIFPQHDRSSEGSNLDDASLKARRLVDAAESLQAKVVDAAASFEASFKAAKVTTHIKGGTVKVTTEDYPMAWKNHLKEGSPSTTHEIAFDMCNGFDEDFLYVSGMTVDRIARVNKKDPLQQQIFTFPMYKGAVAQPHTIRFANVKSTDNFGMLWVGLENQGRIVRLNMPDIMNKYGLSTDIKQNATVSLQEEDFSTICDVRISAPSTPTPINTRPHGFCFDKDYKYIWFTGKLTNTVGRIAMHGTPDEIPKSLQHFELPTLGAVPIYVALGGDGNVWGTCLANSIVFRVTTGDKPVVCEMNISPFAASRRPIAILPDPRENSHFMWLSTEAGHSVCRLDTRAFEKEYASKQESTSTNKCLCSPGCQFLFRANTSPSWHASIITEFPIPKMNHKMKLGGLAIVKVGVGVAIWTQSFVDAEDNPEELPDYVLKIGFNEHDGTNTHDPNRSSVVSMTGVPIEYYELPTKNTILHRIAIDPDERVWFTELVADRIGTIKFEDTEASGKKRDHSTM